MTFQQNHEHAVSDAASVLSQAPGVTHVRDTHGLIVRRMRLAGLIALALGALALSAKPSVFTAPGGNGTLNAEPVLSAVALPASKSAVRGRVADSEQAALTATGLSAKDEQNLVAYLARKWRVADAAVVQIVQTALRAGKEHRVDPMLVLAVLSVESGFNPYAESHAGAQGLMQVMTSVHKEKFERFGGEQAALHPVANIFVGAQILADVVQRGGSMEQGLKLYVGAGNLVNAKAGKFDYTSPGYGIPPVAAGSTQGAVAVKTSAQPAAKSEEAAPVAPAPAPEAGKPEEAKSEKVAAI
jgi:soluble lytic murein transglycosylase-like protein